MLLAAGSGRRFGGDKLIHSVDGETMIARACKLHASLPYAARILVTRPSDGPVQDCAARYAFPIAENPRHLEGIGTSAALGMTRLVQLDDALDGVLFGVCDQPYLTPGVVHALLDQFARTLESIVAPAFDGVRGNPVIFPKDLFAEFSALDGDVGGGAIIRRHPERVRLVPIESAQALTDIDTRSL